MPKKPQHIAFRIPQVCAKNIGNIQSFFFKISQEQLKRIFDEIHVKYMAKEILQDKTGKIC